MTKRRILKKWVKNWLSIESCILFTFIGMLEDFTLLGFFIIIGVMIKLLININILYKYTDIFKEEA